MAFRMVSDTDARTEADAMAFVTTDSGGQVCPTGRVKKVSNGYAVEVFSQDGGAEVPLAAGRQLFAVDAISRDGQWARLVDSFGVTYDAPRSLPAFGSSLLGMNESIKLEVGLRISAYIRGNDFVEAMIEEKSKGAVERPQISTVGPTPESHLVEEARKNYANFLKQFEDGVSDEQPTAVVVKPKVETEQDRNAFMEKILSDLRPRE